MKCDLCNRPAVTFIRYNGNHLCAGHLMRYVEKRVKCEIKKQTDLSKGGTIGVAVSGGKDSMVALSIINKAIGQRRDVDIHCITVDEGIEGYRPPSVDIVREFCRNNDIEFHLRSFRDVVGLTMDDVAPLSGENSPCTYCGVFRRKCMNSVAEEIGARYLATGHNLDDMAQSIMMNFARGDIERMARLKKSRVKRPRFSSRGLADFLGIWLKELLAEFCPRRKRQVGKCLCLTMLIMCRPRCW